MWVLELAAAAGVLAWFFPAVAKLGAEIDALDAAEKRLWGELA